jgi:uncharacterized protein YlxP (DUF503 family)
MYVGLAKLTIWLDGSEKLKYQKSVIQKIKFRLKSNFNISISKTGEYEENRDFVTLGLAIVGGSSQLVETQINNAIDFLDSLSITRIKEEEKKIICFDDLE